MPQNDDGQLDRKAAWTLVCEWTASPSLRRHMLAVEAAMRACARAAGEDEQLWAVTGLLHDLDYERYPDPPGGHPQPALRELEAHGYPPVLLRAIASHVDHLQVPRDTPMARALYAVDELSGFVTACALVRPTGIHGLSPRSVTKKLKDASFAASVDRATIRRGIEALGADLDDHIAMVIAALTGCSAELLLDGRDAGEP